MKQHFFIILLLCIAVFGYSQEKPSFITIKTGASLPIMDYSANNLDNGSFTTTGFNLAIEGAWYFKPHWGIGLQSNLDFHPVDVGLLGWEKVKADPSMEDMYIRSEAYQLINLGLGIYTQWELWNNLSISGKIATGIMQAKTPWQYNKALLFMNVEQIYTITSSRDRSPFYQVGCGLQYQVNPCLALKVDGEFTYSKMKFGFTNSSGPYEKIRDISYINTNFGLIILL
ncbi:MAG: hypothetical protein JEZ03_08925 [Bacteroidales bacterium]|nr:hypothetical protein [Bacteroidales bacterium]